MASVDYELQFSVINGIILLITCISHLGIVALFGKLIACLGVSLDHQYYVGDPKMSMFFIKPNTLKNTLRRWIRNKQQYLANMFYDFWSM